MEEHRHTNTAVWCPDCGKGYKNNEIKDGKCPNGHLIPIKKMLQSLVVVILTVSVLLPLQ